jgi:phenylalanyl-tRNA synthetase beta chain
MPLREEPAKELEQRLKDALVGFGFFEVITYSFISPHALEALRLPPDDPRLLTLPLLNPLAEVQSVMRTTLLPGLLETARYNLSHKNRDLKLFELREVYARRQGEKLPAERRTLAGLITGAALTEGWNTPFQEADFYHAKGCVEQLLAEAKAPAPTFTPVEATPYLSPGKGAVINLAGEKIGTVGELLPEVVSAFELPAGVFIFELDLPLLAKHVRREMIFTPLPRFPSVARDVAVTIDTGISADEIAAIIKGVHNQYIESIEVFDCYEGDPIPRGRKGLAYRIRYRSPDRTMTDEEVNEFHQAVLARLAKVPGLAIR